MSKKLEDESNKKPFFLNRYVAYIIDAFLVLFLSILLSMPFVNVNKISTLAEKSQGLIEKYNSGEISEKEYEVDFSNLEYQLAVNMELITLMGVFIGLIYYVILPLYNRGQTIGKKLMKLRIVSSNGDLSSNQLIFRSFIANSILLNLLSVVFLMFASRDIYTICIELFSLAQYLITFISIIMVIVSKDGLSVHDGVVHTKVIKVS